jgi:hypothetical protein
VPDPDIVPPDHVSELDSLSVPAPVTVPPDRNVKVLKVVEPVGSFRVPSTVTFALDAATDSIETSDAAASIEPDRLLPTNAKVPFQNEIDFSPAATHLPAEFEEPPPSNFNEPLVASTVP